MLLLCLIFAADSGADPGADSGVDSGVGAVSAVDQLERRLVLPAPATRIVTVPMPASSILVAVDGGPDRLAAHHRQSRSAMAEGPLGTIFPALLDIPTGIVGEGFQPNVEEVLKAQPDLVFQWGDRGDDLIRPLEAVGLKVAALRYGTDEDARRWLDMMAALIGKPDRGTELIALRDDVQGRLAPLAALPEVDKPAVLYLFRAVAGFQAAGIDTFNDYAIRLAGGRNAAGALTGFRPVNAEQILAWNPDIILLNSFETGLKADRITGHPLLRLTSAARDGRVHVMPVGGYRWDPPSHESPLAWLWLAQIFHPDNAVTDEIDLRAEITAAYRLFYGLEPSAEMIDGIISRHD